MPIGHESGHMAPLVRIRRLSKSNCTLRKLNCTHMIMKEGGKENQSLKPPKGFIWLSATSVQFRKESICNQPTTSINRSINPISCWEPGCPAYRSTAVRVVQLMLNTEDVSSFVSLSSMFTTLFTFETFNRPGIRVLRTVYKVVSSCFYCRIIARGWWCQK